MTPTAAQLDAALAHAARCAPLESCGLIADGDFIPVANLADERNHFILDGRAFARIDGHQRRVTAIVHSHVDCPPVASETDRAACEKTGLPWVIVSWPARRWCVIEPSGFKAPLVGREWMWGSHDCYGLIRDGFFHYTGIELPDYDRDWQFWKTDDLIAGKVAGSGFVVMPQGTEPQHCDLLGMKYASPVVNHLALFLAPDRILHQLYRRLSVRELYDGPFRDRTALHLRHERFL